MLLQGAAVLLIAALVAAPWYLAVEWQNPGHFLRYYFIDRHVLGFATGTQPHSDQPWWYYLPILLGGGLPWIAYVRWARDAEGGRRKAEGGEQEDETAESVPPSPFPLPSSPVFFLWFWLIGWIVFLTVAQSKLATYLWPAFPPLAILAAVAWTRLIDGSLIVVQASRLQWQPGRLHHERRLRGLSSALPGAGPSCCRRRWQCCNGFTRFTFAWPAWVAVGLVAAVSPLPLIPWYRGRRQASMAAAALSVAAQFVVVMTLILPPLAEMYSARDLAEHFNRVGQIPTRLLVAEERIGSFVFYLDPRLRAGLKEDQVQYLPADPPMRLRPGDVVAVKERNLSKTAEWLDLGDNPYESCRAVSAVSHCEAASG